MSEFETARRNMIEGQLRPNRVDDPAVIAAFHNVPRELFVPKKLRAIAYNDEDLVFEDGYLMEPMTLARMMQYCGHADEEVALVVGDETGYAAAVLARLVATVFLLVGDEKKQAAADALLEQLEVGNVITQLGAPADGLPAQAPFNLILMGGAVPFVPEALPKQLEDGGRLGAVVQPGRQGKLTVVRRFGDNFGRTTPFDATIPRMPEIRTEAGFVF